MAVKDDIMPKVHIRNGALTIPLTDEIREKLDVHDGDELEAHVFEGSLTVTSTSPEARRRAGDRILATINRVRLRPGQRPLTEEEIVEAVKETRRALRGSEQHE